MALGIIFDQSFILSVLPEAKFLGASFSNGLESEFAVDSRLTKSGDIFVALKGSSLDGHDFIKDAILNGASGIIINLSKEFILSKIDKKLIQNVSIILVEDTNVALINLASKWRSQFSYPVIGITGSIGKTTTKEILVNILNFAGLNIISSKRNQNTAIGIAINVLKMRPHHQVAIFEMGISKQGEMAYLANIVRPTSAIITTIGHSHMEGLGSLTDIAHEKRDIFKYFKEDNIGIVHGDLPFLANIAYKHPVVKFGYKAINQVQARKIQAYNSSITFVLKLYNNKTNIQLETNHEGPVLNALAAASAAYLLNISSENIIAGIKSYKALPGRFEKKLLKSDLGLLINDCYNSSPESMKASLLAFEKLESKGQKIAVLGDMLELGVSSPFWHRQIGRLLRKVPSLNHVVLVGNLVKSIKSTLPVGLSYEYVDSWQEASVSVKKRLSKDSVVLVKASNGINLDMLVKELVI